MRRPRSDSLSPAVIALGAVGVLALAVGLPRAGLVFLALAVLAIVASAVGARTRDSERPEDLEAHRVESEDDHALREAQRRLLTALDDPSQLQGSLRPRLTALVVDRLARRGTTLDAPDTRDRLGEPLWTFVTGPPITRRLSVRDLETLLTRVEDL